MGAATKSSSAASRRTTAGRNLPPGDWWNSIRIRTTSPGRSVLDQQFVYRVVFSVRRLKFASTCCPPGGLVHGKVPLQQHPNRLARRDLRCDLARNSNLAVRREFASEAGSLRLFSLAPCIISRARSTPRPALSELTAAQWCQLRTIQGDFDS
jgi:hypothetical protein